MTPYANGSTSLRGKYLIRNRALHTFVRLRDAVWVLGGRPKSPVAAGPPRRLIISIGGHLGDAVIATSILPVVRAAFPSAEIGAVCGSQQRQVLEGHPTLSRIHVSDHWFMSRGARPRLLGLGRSLASDRALVAELRQAGYDVSIDLYPFFPNRAHVFARAGIPTRVGYESGGGGSLLTHPMPWSDTRDHTAEQHATLLRLWQPNIGVSPLRYDLPPIPEHGRASGERLLRERGLAGRKFVVLHPGTGNDLKAWPDKQWDELVERILRMPAAPMLVITGAGPADRSTASRLVARHPEVVSLCDETTWASLRHVISRAEAVVGADSVATHVAAAEGIPSLSVMAAISDPLHWRPLGKHARYLTADVPCAPCFRSRGCDHLSCIRTVSASAAASVVESLLAPRSR